MSGTGFSPQFTITKYYDVFATDLRQCLRQLPDKICDNIPTSRKAANSDTA